MKNWFTCTCLLVGIALTNLFFFQHSHSNIFPDKELAIIDQSLQNYQTIIRDLPKNVKVLFVDDSRGSRAALQSELSRSKNLKRIHLLTHGTDGKVILGGVHLQESNFVEHRAFWEALKSSVAKDAELLIYSCDLASGAKGKAFVAQLSKELGMSVAASTDPTGAVAKGGNWNLEYVAGSIDHRNILSPLAFDGLLVPKFTAVTGGASPFKDVKVNGQTEIIYGDFDNDGDIDIHAYPEPNKPHDFWANNGNGTFTYATNLPTNPFRNLPNKAAFSNKQFARVADFDNDGDDDVFVILNGTEKNVFFRNNGGTFVKQTDGASPFNAIVIGDNNQFLFGDFDNDGDIDLHTWDSKLTSDCEFWRNDGSGNFTNATTSATNPFRNLLVKGAFYASATYGHVADWDNDGDDDIYLTKYDSNVLNVLARNNNGTFTLEKAGNSPFSGVPLSLYMDQFIYGDFDGDGDIDLQATANNSNFFYYRNNGSGTFTPTSGADNPFDLLNYKSPFYSTASNAYVADWDNDGDDDVFTLKWDDANANVFFNQTGAAPKIASVTPAKNATSVSVTTNIVLNFSQNVTRVTGKNIVIKRANNTTVATIPVDNAQVSGTGTSTITINPTADLDGLTSFYVLIDAGAFQDAEGRNFKGYAAATDYVFTTASAPVAPTVTTAAVSSIATTSAILGGNVTSDGNAAVSDRGIVWATTTAPTTSNNKVQNGSSTGVFSGTVNNLPQGTRVYVRAYAINEKGTSYGNEIDFYTKTAVTSITRRGTSPTNANTVSYDVVFAQSVTGAGTEDFSASVSGSTLATVSNISGSGTTYVVTLTISGGNGTARLDFTGLDGTTPNVNQNFTSASSYMIYRASNATDYFRKQSATGNWNTAGTWESSADQSYWITATASPTSSAASVQVSAGATVTVPSGASVTSGALTNSGSLAVNGTLTLATAFSSTGSISGSGTLEGTTITNNGIIAPGNSPGILRITGALVNTNALNMELAGTTPGTGYDQLLVSGAATLGGTLNVSLGAGYTPVLDDEFTIIDAGSISGTFTTLNLPSVAPRIWSTTYNNAAGTLILKVINDPLPVTMARFDAKKSENAIMLSWQTTFETNSSHFEIERSAKNLNWERIGEVAAARESGALQAYDYTDAQPVKGENLYRLKMVDVDGTFAYSKIVAVKFGNDALQLSVYPNPVTEKLYLENSQHVRSVQVYNVAGKLMHAASAFSATGLDVRRFTKGLYVVSITDQSGVLKTFKFVKE